MKIAKNKWLIFLVLIISFVLLNMQVRNVSLSQRGIVLGIGIDKEGDEYIVTSEILAPSNLGAENYQKNRLLCLERGRTLEEAFEKMDKALGVRVSLRHTVLIVLGSSMLQGGEYGPLIDLFVGNDVADSTYIVGVSTDAKSLFNVKPPLYSTISYKIAETFRSPDIESGLVTTSIKDFFKMYMSESCAIYIPVVFTSKGNMSESNGSGKDKETDSINFGKIAILDRTGQKLVLDGDESDGLSYIYSDVNEANLFVSDIENGKQFDVDIIDTICTKKFDKVSQIFTLNIKMWVKMGHAKSDLPNDYISTFDARKKKLTGETIEKSIKSAYLACHEKGVDILGIKNEMFKVMGSSYKSKFGDNIFNKVKINIDLELIVK